MKRFLRVSCGFLIAPVVATLAAMIATAIASGQFSFREFKVVLLFAYFFGLILGVPAFVVFRYLDWNQLWKYVIGGATIGVVASFMLLGIPLEYQPSSAYLLSVLLQYFMFPLGGAIGGATFWKVAVGETNMPVD